MTGRLFVVTADGDVLVDPESLQRPALACARCRGPVQAQQLLRTAGGGWVVVVRCHGELEHDQVPWCEFLAGDVALGPAFDPDTALVRRRVEARP